MKSDGKPVRSSQLPISKVSPVRLSMAAKPPTEGLPRKIHERRSMPPLRKGEEICDPKPSGPVKLDRDD